MPLNRIPVTMQEIEVGFGSDPAENLRFSDPAGVPPSRLPRRVAPHRIVRPGRGATASGSVETATCGSGPSETTSACNVMAVRSRRISLFVEQAVHNRSCIM